MSYMLLIMEPQGQRATRSEAEGRALYDQMLGFADRLKARGVLKACDSLQLAASRVTIRAGKRSVVDGPFTEAKEIVGGYFLLDCSKEQALAFAHECPAAEWATVEVREIGPCFVDAGTSTAGIDRKAS
jgi:hypothetical protein